MIDITVILITAASVSVFFIVTGLLLTVFSPRAAVIGRLEKATGGGEAVGQEAKKTSLKEDFLWVLGRVGRLPARGKRLQLTQVNLIQAGIMMRAEEFIGLTLLTVVITYSVVFLLTGSILIGLLAAIFGFVFPKIYVNFKKSKRSRALTDQLPEALNIISSGLRAGFSFPQALSVLIKEIEGPLTQEFMRTLKENRLGKPMDEALNDMLERIDNDDIELLITALLIQRQVGGNLAEVLDGISHTIRERVRIKGEIRSLTAEGRLTALILSLLPVVVAVLLMIMSPDYLSILISVPLGIFMIIGAVLMQTIGILIVRKIVAIDV